MRIFYIFEVKKAIYELYRDKPSDLFKILNSIYYMHKEDVNYGYNLLNQITDRINRLELDNKIFVDMHKDFIYSKNSDEHIINDIFKNEISILKVNKSHLYLETNRNYAYFFDLLLKYNCNYFVCDFKELDFFFIDEIKNIVKS